MEKGCDLGLVTGRVLPRPSSDLSARLSAPGPVVMCGLPRRHGTGNEAGWHGNHETLDPHYGVERVASVAAPLTDQRYAGVRRRTRCQSRATPEERDKVSGRPGSDREPHHREATALEGDS